MMRVKLRLPGHENYPPDAGGEEAVEECIAELEKASTDSGNFHYSARWNELCRYGPCCRYRAKEYDWA